jgi:hypothetical protein
VVVVGGSVVVVDVDVVVVDVDVVVVTGTVVVVVVGAVVVVVVVLGTVVVVGSGPGPHPPLAAPAGVPPSDATARTVKASALPTRTATMRDFGSFIAPMAIAGHYPKRPVGVRIGLVPS